MARVRGVGASLEHTPAMGLVLTAVKRPGGGWVVSVLALTAAATSCCSQLLCLVSHSYARICTVILLCAALPVV